MNKKLLLLTLLLLTGLLSCYDGLIDTYDNSKLYNLRDRGPAGGWIFYINPNWEQDGWRYLEAAPVDQSAAIVWAPNFTSVTGTLSAVGKGQANTSLIVNFHGRSTTYAARLCDELSIGGYSDWFLPSPDELTQMYTNLYTSGVGGFTTERYWSSKQSNFDINEALLLRISINSAGTVPKMNLYYVRAIRAF